MLFEYYINLFEREDLRFVKDYIETWGFENLKDLISAVAGGKDKRP